MQRNFRSCAHPFLMCSVLCQPDVCKPPPRRRRPVRRVVPGAQEGQGSRGRRRNVAAENDASDASSPASRFSPPASSTFSPFRDVSQICPLVLDAVGSTPMIRLNHIPKSAGVRCEILAKCEFFNAGGLVKDWVGKRTVEDAEREG